MVVLSVWIGGLATLAIGAPVIFSVLEAHDPVGGRTLAGEVFGAVFTRFQHVSWGLGLAMILVLVVRAGLGPRPRRLGIRLWTLVGMLVVSIATAIVIAPRINRLRDATPGPIASLPDTDARKIEFGRLHGLSNALMLLTIAAGVGLVWAEVKDVT